MPNLDAAPRIEVDEQQWDFGKVFQEQTVRHTFVLMNTGDEPLVIRDVRSSCSSCTGAMVADKKIPAGEAKELVVVYQSRDQLGKRSNTLTIVSNDPERPQVVLRIFGSVRNGKARPILSVPIKAWDAGILAPGEKRQLQVTLKNSGTLPLDILDLFASEGCSVKTALGGQIKAGQHRIAQVLLHSRQNKGILQESVVIKTNDPVNPAFTLPITGYISETRDRDTLRDGLVISLQGEPMMVPGTGHSFLPVLRVRNGLSGNVEIGRIGGKESAAASESRDVRLSSQGDMELKLAPNIGQLMEGKLLEIILRIPVLVKEKKRSPESK